MERMPFNSENLPIAPKRYDVYLHDMWLGQSIASTPERAISNVLWTHNLMMILTPSEKDEVYAVEVA